MAQQVTLGGDRVGSGQKQKVELHNYGMTSFNLEQDWKSSMAPGVLYPFLKLVGTNHGTFDIDLDSFVRTLPTRGPLFGSFKLQMDIYNVPIRLYQGLLHNNPVGLGMHMGKVFLPKLKVPAYDGATANRVAGSNENNWQVNDSALLKYLGLSGIGRRALQQTDAMIYRKINAVPALAYYDIFKNYYANKQEENAYVIIPGTNVENFATLITAMYEGNSYNISNAEDGDAIYCDSETMAMKINGTNFNTENVILGYENYSSQNIYEHTIKEWQQICKESLGEDKPGVILYNSQQHPDANPNLIIYAKEIAESQGETLSTDEDTDNFYIYPKVEEQPTYTADIKLQKFNLANIDDMRNFLLSNNTLGTEVIIKAGSAANSWEWGTTSGTDQTGLPYSALVNYDEDTAIQWNAFEMNGLVLKTYQSDLFNNWLDTEFIDGENGISAISSVAVVENKFTMDALNMAEKIYEYLNRVLVSGGTYEDWQEATYGEGAVRKAETPMYIGGMSAEVMFEEVISNSETNVGGDFQPLGSLGGKGTQVGKKGGTNIHVKCEEPCYVIGIVSLTPRISYSQGNDWDLTELDTLDDLHKPAMDGIGFQDLIVEQFAWWNTVLSPDGTSILNRSSAGKQTAWINYQTAVDKCFGDFAKTDGYAFMVLNRNYEHNPNVSISAVKDVTTYIDPAKYNYAFAVSKLSAQNFWVQIHSKVIARRKMGAQQIPNL